MHPKILLFNAYNMMLPGSSPLPEFLPLLTTMSVCLERPKHEVKYLKDHLQKVWCKNIYPAQRYTALLSLAQAGAEPPAGVEPKPREEPPTGCQGHEGSLTKGLVKNIHPALRNSSMSHCDTKHRNQPSKQIFLDWMSLAEWWNAQITAFNPPKK